MPIPHFQLEPTMWDKIKSATYLHMWQGNHKAEIEENLGIFSYIWREFKRILKTSNHFQKTWSVWEKQVRKKLITPRESCKTSKQNEISVNFNSHSWLHIWPHIPLDRLLYNEKEYKNIKTVWGLDSTHNHSILLNIEPSASYLLFLPTENYFIWPPNSFGNFYANIWLQICL